MSQIGTDKSIEYRLGSSLMSASQKIQQKENMILFEYWNKLRAERKAPQRFEIEPSQISNILPHTFILQNEATDSYEFRLAGTQICNEFCFELKSYNLLDLWSHHESLTIQNLMHCVSEDVAVGICDFCAVAENNQKIDYEMLVLPLYHTNFKVSRMLGSMVAKEKPYWLGVSKLVSFQLKGVRLFWAEKKEQPSDVTHVDFGADIQAIIDTNYKIVTIKDRKFRVYDGGLSEN